MVEIAISGDVKASTLRRIARQAYQHYVALMGKEPAPMGADYEAHIAQDTVITATKEGAVVGFAIICEKQDGFWLETIAVGDNHRGKGIGLALLQGVESYVTRSATSYQLYTNEVMRANEAWYLKLGFQITSRKEEAGFRRIFFKKEL